MQPRAVSRYKIKLHHTNIGVEQFLPDAGQPRRLVTPHEHAPACTPAADQRLRATSSGNALHRRSLIAPPKQISPEVTKLLENYYRQGMEQGTSLTTSSTDAQDAADTERTGTAGISARAIAAPPEDSSSWPGEPGFRRRGVSSAGLIEIWVSWE